MGAAIAYYTIFSLAPLLVIVTAVAGLVFSRDAVTGELFRQVRGLVGDDGGKAIEGLVQSAGNPGEGTIAIIGGVIAMIFGATGVFSEIQTAIDRIWEVPKQEQANTWWELIRTRLLAFGMVLSVAFLLLVSLALSAGISAMGALWDRWIGAWETALQLVNILVSIVLFTGVFAAMYRFLPRV
jgi:membrane protein